MTTANELEEASNSVLTTMGVITRKNVVAQVEALLGIVGEICGRYPDEISKINPRAWFQVGIYGKDHLTSFANTELIKRLHETCRHPDWDYESIEHPYKSSYHNQPEGCGWIENVEKDEGYTRHDVTEYHHYRRQKSDALRDDIPLRDLKNITQEKMKLNEYLDLLRERFCKGYMPSSTSTVSCNSKPEYVRFVKHITTLSNGNDVYSMDGIFEVNDLEEMHRLSNELGGDFFYKDGKKSNLIYAMEINGLRILTVLDDDRTFVTAARQNGSWMAWTAWNDYLSLPIDRLTLNKILENI